MIIDPPPWEPLPNNWQPRPWTPQDDLLTTEWLQAQNISVSLKVTEHAVEMVAFERCYHPVLDYLDGLEWDGMPRVDGWMTTYLGAADTPYTGHRPLRPDLRYRPRPQSRLQG